MFKENNCNYVMAVPKKRRSKSKTRVRLSNWKKKGQDAARKALNAAKNALNGKKKAVSLKNEEKVVNPSESKNDNIE